MSGFFPVNYSTADPDALALFISRQYGLTGCRCELLLRGVSDTYRVSTDETGQFIFRVYRKEQRSLADVLTETDLLVSLREKGVSVSYPIVANDGAVIQSIEAPEGRRYAVLFSYAKGRSYQQLSTAQLQSLGREIAAFHNVSATFNQREGARVFDVETLFRGPVNRVAPYFEKDPVGYAWLKSAAERACSALSTLNTSVFPMGYCQFDFLPKNFHFDYEDQVTLFDFDFVGYGWLVNDLMTFHVHVSLDILHKRITREEGERQFNVMVDAYRGRRPLSDEELKAIPWLSLGFWIFYMDFHATHDQFYGMIKEPGQLKLRMDLIRRLIEGQWEQTG